MKITSVFIFAITLLNILFFSSCTNKTPKIGLLMHSYENERWTKDKNYIVESLTNLGAEVFVEVADNKQQKQIMQAEEMIKKGVDVIIIIPINQDEAAKVVEIAHKSNVKVIAYDRLINNCKLDYYISANSTNIGEIMTQYLTSLKPKGKYALIPGSKYDNNSARLFLGQMNVLQPYMERGDIELIYSEFSDDWTPEQGYYHTNLILDSTTDTVAGIITGSDALADGVIRALIERGLDGKVMVSGQDAELDNVKSVIKGIQTCTILKPLKEMAQKSAELAVALALEKPVTMKFTTESNGKTLVKSILIGSSVVNKTNIESTVIASGFHKSSDLNN